MGEKRNKSKTGRWGSRSNFMAKNKGSILLICHEPEFYRDVVTEVWDCHQWTTKII